MDKRGRRELDWRRVRKDKEMGRVFTQDQVMELLEMALRGEYPNNEYSPPERNLWADMQMRIRLDRF